MSSARFARLVQDAYTNNDINAIRDAYHDWQISHCEHPITLKINDSHIQMRRTIQVGCGSCYHCIESKINEWCTRMYAHVEDFKHVYFVTLTYRSITNPDLDANRLLLSKLAQAVWHRDAFNSTHHYSYNPCRLDKSHYQLFLKRLRKNTGLTDITYVLSGEYGKEYGRPHFHMILFTNGVITRSDIIRAWSVCLWRSNSGEWSYRRNQKYDGVAYDFPIGRVDFNDLVTNGTFNTTMKIRIDGTYMNAANCFAYVCKYVVKRDEVNYSRVNLAYNNLYHKEKFIKLYGSEVSLNIAYDWCLEKGFSPQVSDDLINNSKQLSYEKTIYYPAQSIYEHGLLRKRARTINSVSFTEELLPQMYFDFRNLSRPFCEFSRGCPIGSIYARRHLSEFTKGVFNRPLLQDKSFALPKYFVSKAEQYLYGLRRINKTISGQSFALSGLINLYGCINNSDRSFVSRYFNTSNRAPMQDVTAHISLFSEFADVSTGERIVFVNGIAKHFKYNRHTRRYDNTRDVPLTDWLHFWSDRLDDEFIRAAEKRAKSVDNMRLQERAFLMATDLGEEESTLKKRYAIQQKQERAERQKMYHALHNSLE